MTLVTVLEIPIPMTLHVCKHGMPRGETKSACHHPACSCQARHGHQKHRFQKSGNTHNIYTCTYCGMVAADRI